MMRALLVFSFLVLVSVSSPVKSRTIRETPGNLVYMRDVWNSLEESADNSGKEDVKKYTDTLLFDLDNAIKLLNNLPLRDGTGNNMKTAMFELGGIALFLKLDTQDDVAPVTLPEELNEECSTEAVEEQESCDAKFGVIVGCVKQGVLAVIRSLKSDRDTGRKIGFAKSVFGRIGAKSYETFQLADKCFGNKEQAKPFQHWIDTWTASEEDIKNAPIAQQDRNIELLLKDVSQMVEVIDIILAGNGGPDDRAIVLDNIRSAKQLLILDAASGKTSIRPEDTANVKDSLCPAANDENKQGCDARFGVVLRCLRRAMLSVIDLFLFDDSSVVDKIRVFKAVINRIGAGANGVTQLAETCYGNPSFEQPLVVTKAKKEITPEGKELEKLRRLLLEYLNRK
ncbi:uncharacterized protein LOC111120589 isoform X1 [Crassostrea virginica]